MAALNNDSGVYRGLCAPIHKRGTLREDLGSIFQCNDEQNTEIHEARFKRGAECIRRRIHEMARYSANTPANKEKRKRHFIPVTMTYGFAKDCLQRYAPDSEVRDFERNTNKHIARQLGYYRYSIENAMNRGSPRGSPRTLRRNKNLVRTRRRTYRNTNNSNNTPINRYNNIMVTLTR